MENNNKNKLGLVLEGGGARGAYQIGALRALFEAGYMFDGITGTSIGAINGFMIAQDRFDEIIEMWKILEFSSFFDLDDDYATKLASGTYDSDTVKYFIKFFKESFKAKGIDTSKMRAMIKENVDEDLLRASGIDFGVMTVSRTDRRSRPMFLEDIPEGMVADYILASATFPGFQKTVVGEQTFIDGGIYDNMPINMLLDRGYRDIVAIETRSYIPKRKPNENSAQIHYIVPSVKPGRVMDFSSQVKLDSMDLGYMDTIKILRGYIGFRYCIDASAHTPFGYGFADMLESIYVCISNVIDSVFKCIDDLVVNLRKTFKIEHVGIANVFLEIFERVAIAIGIEHRRQVFKLDELLELISLGLPNQLIIAEHNSKYMQELLIVHHILNARLSSI